MEDIQENQLFLNILGEKNPAIQLKTHFQGDSWVAAIKGSSHPANN